MDRRAIEAFQLLGIPRDSDRSTIAHAYRRLARAIHPDVSADADAAQRFASLAEAYRLATAAPEPQRDVPCHSDQVRVRSVGVRSTQDVPIVAGPVFIRPSLHHMEGRRHG